jgi:hypothetical protein
MAETIKIKGREIASLINVDANEQTFEKGPNEGKTYYRARANGRGFIVTPEFYSAWKEGKVAEVSLSESTYMVDDPMNPGNQIQRDSYQLNAFATVDQLQNIIRNEIALAKIEKIGYLEIDLEVQSLETAALGKLKLSDDMVNKIKMAMEA